MDEAEIDPFSKDAPNFDKPTAPVIAALPDILIVIVVNTTTVTTAEITVIAKEETTFQAVG